MYTHLYEYLNELDKQLYEHIYFFVVLNLTLLKATIEFAERHKTLILSSTGCAGPGTGGEVGAK